MKDQLGRRKKLRRRILSLGTGNKWGWCFQSRQILSGRHSQNLCVGFVGKKVCDFKVGEFSVTGVLEICETDVVGIFEGVVTN